MSEALALHMVGHGPDPLHMAAKRLGESKREAEALGAKLVREFDAIEEARRTLADNGLDVATVTFAEPAIHVAYNRHVGAPFWERT